MYAGIKSQQGVSYWKVSFPAAGCHGSSDISTQHVVILRLDLGHLASACSHLLSCCKFVCFKLNLFFMYSQLRITTYRKQTWECRSLWPFSMVLLLHTTLRSHLSHLCCGVGHIAWWSGTHRQVALEQDVARRDSNGRGRRVCRLWCGIQFLLRGLSQALTSL